MRVIEIVEKAVRSNCNLKEDTVDARHRFKSTLEGEHAQIPEMIFAGLCDAMMVKEEEVMNYMCWTQKQYDLKRLYFLDSIKIGTTMIADVRDEIVDATVFRSHSAYGLAIQYSMCLRQASALVKKHNINILDIGLS